MFKHITYLALFGLTTKAVTLNNRHNAIIAANRAGAKDADKLDKLEEKKVVEEKKIDDKIEKFYEKFGDANGEDCGPPVPPCK